MTIGMAQKEREAAAALPAGSVLAVLYEQHARIRELFELLQSTQGPARQTAFDSLREMLAVHEAGEEMVLRPASEKIAGEGVIAARDREESEFARALADLEELDIGGAEFARKIADLEKAVSEHAQREENEEFPRILAGVSQLDQLRMGDRLLTVDRAAAAHQRGGTGGSAAAMYTVGPFAALLESARNAFPGE
jgi:hypothetical protein